MNFFLRSSFKYIIIAIIAFAWMWITESFLASMVGGVYITQGFPITYYKEEMQFTVAPGDNKVLINRPELAYVNYAIFYGVTLLLFKLISPRKSNKS